MTEKLAKNFFILAQSLHFTITIDLRGITHRQQSGANNSESLFHLKNLIILHNLEKFN